MLCEKYLNKQETYIVGVSGGCDSMALLTLLNEKGYKIIVAHVNYNFRNDTYLDYQVVYNYCKNNNIIFKYLEVEKDHEVKGNFQANARDIRYNFYKELYNEYNASAVILGHHKDDHLETIYMYLNRGSKSKYLGLKMKNIVKDMVIIRPLLNVYKKDIREYCENNHISYHDDYTNFETDFERDRVRNTILNTYSEMQKEQLLLKADHINKETERQLELIKPYINLYKENNKINYKLIDKSLMDIFLFELLNMYLDSSSISQSLIDEIKNQMYSVKPNINFKLPIHFMFIKEYDNISIQIISSDIEYCYIINSLKEKDYPYFNIRCSGHKNEGIYMSDDDFPLTIRNYRNGDKIKTSGGSKKVNRLFIEKKIPLSDRKKWPIVLNKDNEIILIPLIAKRIGYLATNPNFFVIK